MGGSGKKIILMTACILFIWTRNINVINISLNNYDSDTRSSRLNVCQQSTMNIEVKSSKKHKINAWS